LIIASGWQLRGKGNCLGDWGDNFLWWTDNCYCVPRNFLAANIGRI